MQLARRYFILGSFLLLGAAAVHAQQLKLFHSIEGVIPGITGQAEVIRKFGTPESIETTAIQHVAGVKIGGAKVLSYPKRGLVFIFDNNTSATNPVVDAVRVEAPYKGRSPEGLVIGAQRDVALAALRAKYVVSEQDDDFAEVAKTPESAKSMAIWFKDGVVSGVKLFR